MVKASREELQAIHELSNRSVESLRLFRALPRQEGAFSSTARELLLRGGNRSLSSDSVVHVEDRGYIYLDTVNVGDRILAFYDGDRDVKPVYTEVVAKRVYREDAFELKTVGGRYIQGTTDHPVLLRKGGSQPIWQKLSDVTDGSVASFSDGDIVWDEVLSVNPVGEREITAIKTSTQTYIANGMAQHNSGKSTVASILFAAIATNRPVYDHEGKPIEVRWKHQRGRKLTMWCIGYGQQHIGQTLYRLLFRPGLFKIIRDEKSRQWRAFRPWDAADQKRKEETKPSPPLIPSRYIKPNSFAWENKGEKVFTKVEIIDPMSKEEIAEIYAFTSSGEVKAGDPVDVIWVDEAIKYPSHYAEWQARLIDRRGRIFWSSWPEISNDALTKLTERAKDSEEKGDGRVAEFVYSMSGNPHLESEAKQDAISGWSEEERQARDLGEYLTEHLRMYPMFDENIHSAICVDPTRDDDLSAILRKTNGEPPGNWTRELILDPGTTNPAVLFCAVPPPELGHYYVPYQEIYIPRLNAEQLAEKILQYSRNWYFERFIIDPKAGAQTPMGFGKTIERNYSDAFAKCKLTCAQTYSGFSWGSVDVAGRIGMVHKMLSTSRTGFPYLRIVTQRCPNLCKQLRQYNKQVQSGFVSEFKPAPRQKIDLAVCLEYWASRDPEYIPPPQAYSLGQSPMERVYQSLIGRNKKKKKQSESILLGPPSLN